MKSNSSQMISVIHSKSIIKTRNRQCLIELIIALNFKQFSFRSYELRFMPYVIKENRERTASVMML